MKSSYRPVTLVILDGWGVSDTRPSAVTEASTPNMDRLLSEYPHSLLGAAGEAVGLMPGQMGDSNVGHLNIGAGRIVYQDLVRINRDISRGAFFSNPALVSVMDSALRNDSWLHIMGLVSDGGVHSHEDHLIALLKMAKDRGLTNVAVHAFLDGRDVPPTSAAVYLERLEQAISRIGVGKIASIAGRYYAMDRDKRWDRTQAAYVMLTEGEALSYHSWREALESAYSRGETDEFVKPSIIIGGFQPICDRDSVIFINFRADRARQISHALVDEEFAGFPRAKHPRIAFCGMLRYEPGLNGEFAYEPLVLKNTLGEVVSNAGLKQLRIAETEKYAHVTFFFNGKREEPYPGEDRCLIPSPKVATYDLKPEMSAREVTSEVIERLRSAAYDLVVLNYANPDMVGHTGVFEAAVKAVETCDECVGKVVETVLELGGALLIIGDHGNVEELTPPDTESGSAHTYHTCNPVNCILVTPDDLSGVRLREGNLGDVAPTILHLLGLEKPADMEGQNLIVTEVE